MWEFEEDGEMFSAKCVQGFLPELFSRWSESGTNHVVSIVLFTRVLYEGNDMNVENLQRDPYGRSCQDFYRVLADWETAQNWAPLLTSIKRELLNFQKDIMQLTDSSGSTKIAGTNTHASEGNILEAVNLALNPFDKHYVDRDLSRTGLSIVIVTPGTGIFEVDKTLCRMTNRRMTDNGIGLDLVCLSKPPLHSVPLFQLVSADTPQSKTSPVKQEVSSFPQRNSYLSETSPRSLHKAGHNMSTSESSFSSDLHQNSINTGFSLPSWVDISFWSRPSTARTFTPRCKMYEIQMIGLLEGGRTQLHVPFLKDNVPDSNDQNVPIFNGSDARIISTKTARNLTGDESGNQNSKNSRGLNGNEIGSVGENIVDQYMNEIDILAAKLYRKKEHQLYDENVFKAVDAKPQKIRKEESPALFTTVLGEDQDPASPDVMDSRPMMGNSKSITIPIRKRADPHNNSLARSASHSRGSYSGSESGSPVGSYRRSNRSAKSQSVKSMVAHIAADQSFTNPWNPSKSVMKGDGNVYRWEHINPAQVSHISMETTHGYMKWKSLCTPACLPLTTAYFPDPDQLSKLYMEYTYKVSQEDDKIRQSRSEMQQKAEVFMLELVRQRLAQGFQLIVPNINDLGALSSTGTAGRKKGSMLEKLNDPIPGSRPYFVSLGDHVHKLSYDGVGAVEVKRYIKMFSYSTKPIHYECKIWPKHQKGYEARRVEFAYPPLADYNWSYMDNLISGYQDQMTDALRFWRTRYLVIPMETPPISAGNSPDDTLDDEEERIGGFKKFLELLKKASIDKDNPKNAIQVNFTTFNVSGFVKNEAASIRESGDMPVTNSENLTTASSLLTVAVAMQQPNEVTIKERRWHFQLFDQVFVGEELIDWLVRRFSDITTRESAVAYGNTLLKQGVFEHVLGKHKLLGIVIVK